MRLALALAALLVVTPALASGEHGGHAGHEGHDMDHMADLSRFGEPGDPAKADRTITIKAREMAYDLSTLTIRAGETIKFVLVNEGTQSHELGIGDAEYFAAHRKMMASMKMDHGDMPNMTVAEMGETKSFAWTFTKPGAFEFSCSMPGHAELGMVGKIVVQ